MHIRLFLMGICFGIAILAIGWFMVEASTDTVSIFQPFVCADGELFKDSRVDFNDNGEVQTTNNIYCYLDRGDSFEATQQIWMTIGAAAFVPVFIATLFAILLWRIRR
jgi:hypothetical protein